jgi:acetylornithine aminotransferase/acetylornithine/N-succinyldiaminopimelate aminotransferase
MNDRVILPTPPPILKNQQQEIRELFQRFVVPSYGRFNLALSHGAGSHVWDVSGKRYLDLGGGIAVCSLGHAHPEITEALVEQSRRLVHVSNLYYQEPQGRLAQRLVGHLAPGKVFFCNSGAEANEGLFKTARKFGHDEGRFEILTAVNSFHGRTLGGISATGQEKVKKGFEPMVEGFRHIPFNDLDAARAAISPATAAILIEGIQGEGGITPASAEYLLGLRKLCDEKRLLLGISAPVGSRVTNGCLRGWRVRKAFPWTASPWPSPWAGASPSGPSGCATRRMEWSWGKSSGPARMAPPSAVPRSAVPWRCASST